MKYLFSFIFFLSVGLKMGCAQPQMAMSMHGDVKYLPGQPFAYVDPKAPKGGTLTLGVAGSFNTLNPFALQGDAPYGLTTWDESLVFEALMVRSADEPFTLYGLLAEKVELAPNRRWIVFHLNPRAQWSDGRPVTADDVMFSYQTFSKEGRAIFQLHYSQVESADILSPLAIKFSFKLKEGKPNRELPFIMALMPIIPRHAFKDQSFRRADFQHIPGTGPYKVFKVSLGKEITYHRRQNYWAKDLAVRQGFFNFDVIRCVYFFNAHLPLEAFKAGTIDFIRESNPVLWERNYCFPGFSRGDIKKIEYEHQIPMGMEGIVLNTRQPLFKDRRVRLALALIFSFNVLNKNLYANHYRPYVSFFDNSGLASGSLYTLLEKKIIEQLPPQAQASLQYFEQKEKPLFTLPDRQRLKEALRLLKEAGWVLEKGRLVDQMTKKPFRFEICISNPEKQKIALYFQQALKKIGAKLVIRFIDAAQYEKRLRQFDFDSVIYWWGQSRAPGNEQQHYWTTQAARNPGSRNCAGIADPVIDYCCQLIATASDRPSLEASVKVLDRLLLKGAYVLPLGYNRSVYAAHAGFLAYPPINPKVGVILSTWWHKPVKSEGR